MSDEIFRWLSAEYDAYRTRAQQLREENERLKSWRQGTLTELDAAMALADRHLEERDTAHEMIKTLDKKNLELMEDAIKLRAEGERLKADLLKDAEMLADAHTEVDQLRTLLAKAREALRDLYIETDNGADYSPSGDWTVAQLAARAVLAEIDASGLLKGEK